VSDSVTQALDNAFLRKQGVIVQRDSEGKPKLLLSDMADISIIPIVAYMLGEMPQIRRVSTTEFDSLASLPTGTTRTATTEQHTPLVSPSGTPSNGKVVSDIDAIIRNALRDRGSDIHFEPQDGSLRVRVRIDGVLHHRNLRSGSDIPEMLSRLKIMSGLDIAEKRRPQDGRIQFQHEDRTVDVRVSIIPTEFGEKAVLRLLDKAQLKLDLTSLGFAPAQLELFKRMVSLPNGIILVTGPTGSGKTTTLYAALEHLKAPHVNISTIEDPIEYHLEGINQTQVKSSIDVTFATMLRAILRQDPNIVMIGEIRDSETLEIAIRASLTGHLVLSTIHTNSAIATLPRLTDMGAEPYLLASSLRLIVAQRLVRRVCLSCATEPLSDEQRVAAKRLGVELTGQEKMGRGCEQCGKTGFLGRIAIYELLSIDEDVRAAIGTKGGEQVIADPTSRQRYEPMLIHGKRLIAEGVTTPSELLRELSA
jgi:type IV pilus assembly protein PilB